MWCFGASLSELKIGFVVNDQKKEINSNIEGIWLLKSNNISIYR